MERGDVPGAGEKRSGRSLRFVRHDEAGGTPRWQRVAPSERLRRELDEKLAGIEGREDPVEEVARLGARLVLQQALEDEVSDVLGRGPTSARRSRSRIATAMSRPRSRRPRAIPLERPRLRSAEGLRFESRIVGKGVARTYALETLTICSLLRGLSVRDVEAVLEEVFNEQWCRSRPSRGSARTRASATSPGAGAASASTTSSTCSSTRCI